MSSVSQRRFSGGEISPSLYADVDIVKYATGARTLRNTWVRRDGGTQNRSGTQFISETGDPTSIGRLFPFEFSISQTYILEFSNLLVNVWREGVLKATVVSPFAAADLSEIRYSQSADIITFTHSSYPVYNLIRSSDTSWAFDTETLGADAEFSDGAIDIEYTLAAGAAGAFTYRYCVTGILENGEETTPLVSAAPGAYHISAITKANPAVITVSVSTGGIITGDLIRLDGIGGMTELNGRYFTANVISGTTLSINIDSTNFSAFTSGGQVMRASVVDTSAAVPTLANPNVIGDLSQASEFIGGNIVGFNVYLNSYGIYGFIGTTSLDFFNDTGFTLDPSINPPEVIEFFDSSSTFPLVNAYIQQRKIFANFPDDTEKVALSATGRYHKFTKGHPLVDSDAIKFSIAGRKVSSVQHILDLGQLILFTTTGEFSAEGGTNGVITPGEVNLKQHSSYGCNSLAPIPIDGSALFVQARGSIVRDLIFDFASNGFRGNDLTSFATHLFDGHTIVDWTYQQTPNSTIWAVRDDGILLALTYVKEQQILAWHHHDFENGIVENVCCVPEGTEDVLYVIIKRTIDGATTRYLERFHTRFVDEDAIEDSVFVDSSLSYDGRNSDITTMTLSGGTTWKYTEALTLTASSSFFIVGDVGNEIHINLVDDDPTSTTFGDILDRIRCKIIAYTSGTVVTVYPHKTVPVTMRSIAFTTWSRAVDEVSGLDHLEGMDVSVFADGFVVANPNNSKYTVQTVSSGTLSFEKCYSVIHVGLPITADVETLAVDTPNGETIVDRNKLVTGVTVYLEKSRGGFVGPKPPPDESTDFLGGLIEFKPRSTEGYDDPAALKTGAFELGILPEWTNDGRVFIRQTDPLPMSILAVVSGGLFPFRN